MELYEKSRGAQFGLSREQFAAVLEEIGAKYLPAAASPRECSELYGSLRVEDLALARACAAGNQPAWEAFLLRYRSKLYDIAAYITKEGSSAHDLADSLYGDLYGTNAAPGQRVSKLASYTGRGSLEGWLRSVMAQEYIDRYRRQRRLVSLDEKDEDGAQFAALTQNRQRRWIPELRPRPTQRWPRCRRKSLCWLRPISIAAPWRRSRVPLECTNPPPAASSISLPSLCANKSSRRWSRAA